MEENKNKTINLFVRYSNSCEEFATSNEFVKIVSEKIFKDGIPDDKVLIMKILDNEFKHAYNISVVFEDNQYKVDIESEDVNECINDIIDLKFK